MFSVIRKHHITFHNRHIRLLAALLILTSVGLSMWGQRPYFASAQSGTGEAGPVVLGFSLVDSSVEPVEMVTAIADGTELKLSDLQARTLTLLAEMDPPGVGSV